MLRILVVCCYELSQTRKSDVVCMNRTIHLQCACNQWKKGGGTKIVKHKRIFQHLLGGGGGEGDQEQKHPKEGGVVFF